MTRKIFDDYGLTNEFRQAGNLATVRKWVEKANNEDWVEHINGLKMEAYKKGLTVKIPASTDDVKEILKIGVTFGKEDKLYIGERPIIPIIFVPGIMGTRLRVPGSNEKIWNPDDAGFMLTKYYLGKNIKKREVLGLTSHLRADLINADNGGFAGSTIGGYNDYQLSRGFSNIAADKFYKKFLLNLDSRRFNVDLGNKRIIQPLCPVYVCGYDWRRDMDETADEYLGATFKKLKDLYEKNDNYQGVVIITHSMGGLITRRFLKNPKENADFVKKSVKAVIHGVLPAVGAVIFYCYFKCGASHFNGFPMDSILGKTKMDFEILISDVTGGIELAPTNDYAHEGNNKNKWLTWDEKICIDTGKKSKISNIYTDCYLERKGLLGFLSNDLDKNFLSGLKRNIDASDRFHRNLGLYCHDKTYEASSTGRNTCTSVSLLKNLVTIENLISYHRIKHDKTINLPDAHKIIPFKYDNLTREQKELFDDISKRVEDLVKDNKDNDQNEINKIKKRIVEKFWNFQDERLQVDVIQIADADGTVPLNSQRALSNNGKVQKDRVMTVDNIEHGDFYNNIDSINAIMRLLETQVLKEIVNEKQEKK